MRVLHICDSEHGSTDVRMMFATSVTVRDYYFVFINS